MLKNKLYIYSIILVLCACNSIDENERFLDYEPPTSDRNILLEEFTGQECQNCPEGAAEAKRLQESYNHKVIVIEYMPEYFRQAVSFERKLGMLIGINFIRTAIVEGIQQQRLIVVERCLPVFSKSGVLWFPMHSKCQLIYLFL